MTSIWYCHNVILIDKTIIYIKEFHYIYQRISLYISTVFLMYVSWYDTMMTSWWHNDVIILNDLFVFEKKIFCMISTTLTKNGGGGGSCFAL